MKVCVVTGSRADYGLLYNLIKKLSEDDFFQLHLSVTGMHLSDEFGSTQKEIISDFKIDSRVESLEASDNVDSVSKSIAKGINEYSKLFKNYTPDLLIVLGDRYEIFAAVIAAMSYRIPIAHCHGGEITEGSMDDSIRHSISKFSHLHFTASEKYKKRVIQLGESPNSVFNVGPLVYDNINNNSFYSKRELEQFLGRKFNEINFLVTFHPLTLEKNLSEIYFKELLISLSSFPEALIIFTSPNSDQEGLKIKKLILEFVSKNNNSVFHKSLGYKLYLSFLKNVNLVIGNSSSGIIEAPIVNTTTINIGNRQKGRDFLSSVISCEPNKYDIREKIKMGLDLREKIDSLQKNMILSPSEEIIRILKTTDFKNILFKKFNDLN